MDKYKVLVFGSKTFGRNIPNIKSEIYDVTFQQFPEKWDSHKRASNYSIIILDYSAFWINGSVYQEAQEIFDKELTEAIDKGSVVCFLHYNEDVPIFDEYDLMEKKSVETSLQLQIGFRFLYHFSIRSIRRDLLFHNVKLKRTEFKNYFDKWGVTKNIFACYAAGKFDDNFCHISGSKDYSVAFAQHINNGIIVYLPCQRNFSNMEEIAELFRTLIDNLITYITRIRTELPEFAREPFFEEEIKLYDELKKTEEKIQDIENSLKPFYDAKTLAFASEYRFQELLPKFLKDEFDLSIEQDETYNEDFWLLDSSSKRIAICETKSYIKGFSKSGVYDIFNHREHYKLDESFPGVLFVNLNLNASGWKQKLSPIAPQDYQVATSHNILVVRVEDLLFMWYAFKNGRISKEDIIKILTTNKGWLYFKSDYTYEIKK